MDRSLVNLLKENRIEDLQLTIFNSLKSGESLNLDPNNLIGFLCNTGRWDYFFCLYKLRTGLLSDGNWRQYENQYLSTRFPEYYLQCFSSYASQLDSLTLLRAAFATGDINKACDVAERILDRLRRLVSKMPLPAKVSEVFLLMHRLPSQAFKNSSLDDFFALDRHSCSKSIATLISLAHRWGFESRVAKMLGEISGTTSSQIKEFEKDWGPIDLSEALSLGNLFDIRQGIDVRRTLSADFFTIVYGQEYVKYFNDLCIPSIVNSIDFPSLLEQFRPIWTIYTTRGSVPHLTKSIHTLKALGIGVRINFSLFESCGEHCGPSVLRGVAWQASVLRAVSEQTILVSLIPDAFYGGRFSQFLARCPQDGAAGTQHLRVLDSALIQTIRKSSFKGLKNQNASLLGLGLSECSHFWTRSTMLRRATRSPERQLIAAGDQITHSHACPVVLAIRPSLELYNRIDAEAPWMYGPRPDRWLNACDHFLPWELTKIAKIYISPTQDEFTFLEASRSNSYLNVNKVYRGLLQNEKAALCTPPVNWDLGTIRGSLRDLLCRNTTDTSENNFLFTTGYL